MVRQIEPIDEKFVESFEIDEWEIETEDGWRDITHLHKTIKYDVWELRTLTHSLRCADDHIVMVEGFKEKFVKDLTTEDKVITDTGLQKVISVKKIEIPPEEMFDLTVNSKKHTLFTNGILSHNTTVSIIFLLWYALFNKDKTVAIVAHKQEAAIDILKRIKTAITMLPLWLQQGLTEDGWNKKSVVFENGSRILASATSAEALTSLTVNLLFLDEFAKVPPHVAEEFITSTYPVISSYEGNKIIMVSCVTKDTFIFTNDGLRQISDLIDENKNGAYKVKDYKIVGFDGMRTGNIMFNNGKAKTNIIETTFGKLECSENHKLWACKNGKYGWFKSSELSIGDFIAIKYGMNIWGNFENINFKSDKSLKYKNILNIDKIDKKLAYFFGLFLAEGSVYKKFNKNNEFIGGTVNITCNDSVKDCLDSLGFKYYFDNKFHYSISSKDLILFLEEMGFDLNLKAKEKFIPNKLLSMSKENIISMLSGIFDGNGYSRKDKGIVGISMNSKKMILQIKMLLLNLGIITNYLEIDSKPTKKVPKITKSFRLLMDKENSKIFYDLIGFKFERKQYNSNFLNFKWTRNSYDIIPFSYSILKKYSQKLRVLSIFNGKHNSDFSRKLLLSKKNEIESLNIEELNVFLKENVQDNLKWFPIKKITKSENEVYDVSLDHIENDNWCHSVLYNGIVGHQTPKGLNHFYEFWSKAVREDNTNNFFPISVGWWEVPGRDKKWKEQTIADIGPIRFAQEFQCVESETLLNIKDVNTGDIKKIKIGDLFNLIS